MVWQLLDSMTHSLSVGLSAFFHSHTQARTTFTVWMSQCPQSLIALMAIKARDPISRSAHFKVKSDPWEAGLEARGWKEVKGGERVIHVCWSERFLPSNWPWATQQVVHGVGQDGDSRLQSHPGSNDLPPSPPLGSQAEEGAQTQAASQCSTGLSHHSPIIPRV